MAVGFRGGGICTHIITFELQQVTDKLYCIKLYQVHFVKDGD
jgi:predicted nucleic acid-binding Zn finger protein